jgi:hypothetical protein
MNTTMWRFILPSSFCLIGGLVIYSCSPVRQADNKAARHAVKTIYPTQAFDSVSAKQMLTYGSAGIKGLIYKKTNKLALVGGKVYGANVRIILYPVTPYLMEFFELRKTRENKKTKVFISDEANRYRLEVTSDDYGRFTFEKMKPGRYFLHAIMTTRQSYSQDVEVGTNSYGTRFYEKQRFTETKNYRLEQLVEIKNENDVVEVVLK